MVDSIRKIFHTDKWWGKTILVLVSYVFYWIVFYGSWLFIPRKWLLERDHSTQQLFGILLAFFLFILLPILSFLIPRFIRKIFEINKHFLYSFHVFFVMLSITIFLALGIIKALSNMQIG